MCFQMLNKTPGDNLTKLAAMDVDELSKTRGISKGVLFNVQQSLSERMGT